MHTFEQLQVWKEARSLRNQIERLVKRLPKSEQYRLSDQIIRSSRSITANIAEGYGRYHEGDAIRHCFFARGSLFETLDHLICARDLDLISEKEFLEYRSVISKCSAMLDGFIKYLKINRAIPSKKTP